ncbi:hypothetical protein TNCV_2048021 [Trichonephila clavipes]|nr:hypothetical protein TNCV_2048021 [Trichonephila clavipes]
MAQHTPRKPAPVEYSTDEEDMIVYDVEENEFESNPDCHDALGGKDAVWPCISLALPPPTPGREQLLPPLQNTQPSKGTLDTVLSPPKWENDY